MPTPTYTPLANITLGSSAASVTFSSFTAGYRDLIIVMNVLGTSAGEIVKMNFNGDTTSIYNFIRMSGNGSTAASSAITTWTFGGTSSTIGVDASEFNQITSHLLDFSATDKHKTVLNRSDRAGSGTSASTFRWPSTSAITSISLALTGGSFASGSSFALYGIAA